MFRVNKMYRNAAESILVKPFCVVLSFNNPNEEDEYGGPMAYTEAVRVADVDAYAALRAAFKHFAVDESDTWFHHVVELHYFKDKDEEEAVETNGPMILQGL